MSSEEVLSVLNKALNQTAKIRKGSDAVYFCPVCKHRKRKLEINLANGKYNCWVCGFSGVSLRSLFHKLNVPSTFYKKLNLYSSTPRFESDLTDIFSEKITSNSPVSLPKEFIPLHRSSINLRGRVALNYLKKRRITEIDILRYNIGYCEEGEFKDRIIIPSYDAGGSLNFYSGRSFIGNNYKYKLCDSSKNIIGFENLINFDLNPILVEGQFDAIAVRHNVIPLFGKTMSLKLKEKIASSNVKSIYILLDNDALSSSLLLCSYFLKNNITPYLVKMKDKDPSEIGFEETWRFIDKATKIDYSELCKLKLSLI